MCELPATICRLGALCHVISGVFLTELLSSRHPYHPVNRPELTYALSYICEIAPKARRGMMVAMPQMMVTLGTCLGYFTCYGTIKIAGDMQWRLPFIVQTAGGFLFAVGCFLLPKSPRWLIMRNKQEAALHSMKLLDLNPEEIDHDHRQSSENDAASTLQSLKSMFCKKYRSRTFLALFILGMVQLCGIDGVLYVSIPSETLVQMAKLRNV